MNDSPSSCPAPQGLNRVLKNSAFGAQPLKGHRSRARDSTTGRAGLVLRDSMVGRNRLGRHSARAAPSITTIHQVYSRHAVMRSEASFCTIDR